MCVFVRVSYNALYFFLEIKSYFLINNKQQLSDSPVYLLYIRLVLFEVNEMLFVSFCNFFKF